MADIRTAAQRDRPRVIRDFQGDGVFRDNAGTIWMPLSEVETAVKGTVALTVARVTPTREQLEDVIAQCWAHEIVDAVLKLMQELTEGDTRHHE